MTCGDKSSLPPPSAIGQTGRVEPARLIALGGDPAVSREAFERAVAALIEATRPSKANIQAATAANRTLLAECDGLDQPALNLALGQLAEGLAVRGVEHPALLATACAALVERG